MTNGRADVIVVGAGSAGCVLAARLSEDPTRTVLLLEAGADDVVEPAAVSGPSFFDALDEPGRTWPSLRAQRVEGGPVSPYLRGRGVGGSSAVNAMIAMMAPAGDYDRWSERYGCAGWDDAAFGAARATVPMPLTTVPAADWGPVDRALADAAARWGAAPATLTRWPDGRRASTASVYLEPARSRPNLEVRGGTLVDRVLLDGRRATGVRLADGTELDAGEVIVTAGALHSPAVLLRSGVDRPGTGQGLQDHPSCALALELREPVHPAAVPMSCLASFELGGVELQLLPMNHVGAQAPGWAALALGLMRVRSRGRVTLTSDEPTTDPDVRLNLLGDDRDVSAMVEGVKVLREVATHRAFRSICSGIYVDDRGTTLDQLADDPASVESWLRARTGDYVHASSTCRMGDPLDDDAVVDPECRVIGTRGLRVCDASVFPELPAANPHLTVVLVAELLAQRIRSR